MSKGHSYLSNTFAKALGRGWVNWTRYMQVELKLYGFAILYCLLLCLYVIILRSFTIALYSLRELVVIKI